MQPAEGPLAVFVQGDPDIHEPRSGRLERRILKRLGGCDMRQKVTKCAEAGRERAPAKPGLLFSRHYQQAQREPKGFADTTHDAEGCTQSCSQVKTKGQ